MIRSFKVLSPATLSVIGERFEVPPWGLEGGSPGKVAKLFVVSRGEKKEMPGKFTVDLDEGDEVIIETPGGGGYGKA